MINKKKSERYKLYSERLSKIGNPKGNIFKVIAVMYYKRKLLNIDRRMGKMNPRCLYGNYEPSYNIKKAVTLGDVTANQPKNLIFNNLYS